MTTPFTWPRDFLATEPPGTDGYDLGLDLDYLASFLPVAGALRVVVASGDMVIFPSYLRRLIFDSVETSLTSLTVVLSDNPTGGLVAELSTVVPIQGLTVEGVTAVVRGGSFFMSPDSGAAWELYEDDATPLTWFRKW